MSFRHALLTVSALSAGRPGVYELQQLGLLTSDSLAGLAPFPGTTLTQASSGMTSLVQIAAINPTAGQLHVGDSQQAWWFDRRRA
jgi:hypothetical protein